MYLHFVRRHFVIDCFFGVLAAQQSQLVAALPLVTAFLLVTASARLEPLGDTGPLRAEYEKTRKRFYESVTPQNT